MEIVSASGTLCGGQSGTVAYFLGIPYAQAPVGQLRWKPPEFFPGWTGVREARAFGSPCMQHLDTIPVITERQRTPSEDCLYLNVWSPAAGEASAKLPVMVWFHGGAFVVGSGSAAEFDGAKLAHGGVVVVTVNYRLGAFGFFSHPELTTESPNDSSGNYGLLDQLCALEWVRDHISAFGGDPRCVTIFGESAGGISISCHLTSPQSRGLFSQAIMQSGTWFTIPHGLPEANTDPEKAAETASGFAARLGCVTPGRIVENLRRRTAKELLEACQHRMLFSPVIDGWFLTEDPARVFEEQRAAPVPAILGYNADEGTRFTHTAPGSPEAEALALRMSIVPTERVAHSMPAAVYAYCFTRVPKTRLAAQCGAYHGIEVPYIFGNLDRTLGYDDEDFVISGRMMHYWTMFARNGFPDPPDGTTWPPYDKIRKNVFNLGGA